MMNCGVDPARARVPAGAEGPLPRARRVPRVRRGEDRRDASRTAAPSRPSASRPTSSASPRRSAAGRRAARSARPRSCSARSCAASTTWRARSTATRSRWRPARADPHRGPHDGRVRGAGRASTRAPEGAAARRDRALPAARLRDGPRREGLGDLLARRRCASTGTRSASTSGSRTSRGSSSRTAACSSRRGPSRRPGRSRSGTRDEDARRYVENFEEFAAAATS